MRQADQKQHWYFHEQAEFIPTQVEDVLFSALFDAPEEWHERLVAAGFMQTGEAWVLAGLVSDHVARYISPDIERREVPDSFFLPPEPEPEETRLLVPPVVIAELEVFRRGDPRGLQFELGEQTGGTYGRADVQAVVDRALEGFVDDETLVVFEMAYLRLDEDVAQQPDVLGFSGQLNLERVVGYNWQLAVGDKLAEKGQYVTVGEDSGRLSQPFHSRDAGAWLLKEPIIWVQDIYATPNYVWVEAGPLRDALGLPREDARLHESPEPAVEPAVEAAEPVVDLFNFWELDEGEPEAAEPEPEPIVEPAVEESTAEATEVATPEADSGPAVEADEAFIAIEQDAGPSHEFDIERDTKLSAQDYSSLPGMSLTGEEFSAAALVEAMDIAKADYGAVDPGWISCYLVDGGVFMENRGELNQLGTAYKGVVDITERCPKLAEISQSFNRVFGSDFSSLVNMGLRIDLSDNNVIRPKTVAYPYLANGAGAFDISQARFGLQRAVERAFEHGAVDSVEGALQLHLSGRFDTPMKGGTIKQSWYRSEQTLGSFCAEVMGWVEASKERSKAVMIEQARAAGLEPDSNYLDTARIRLIRGFTSGPIDNFTRLPGEDLKPDLPAKWTASELAELQHLAFALVERINGPGAYTVIQPGFEYITGSDTSIEGLIPNSIQLLHYRDTHFVRLEEGEQALLDAVNDTSTRNVPNLYSTRLEGKSVTESKEAFRQVGLPWVHRDGSFGQGKLYHDATSTLCEPGQLDRLFGYLQKVKLYKSKLELTRDYGSDHFGYIAEQHQAIREHAEAGTLTQADTTAYFDPESRAYQLLGTICTSLYAEDVSAASAQFDKLLYSDSTKDEVCNWGRNIVMDAIGPRIQKQDDTGEFYKRVLSRFSDQGYMTKILAAPNRPTTGADVAIIAFTAGRNLRWTSRSLSTTTEPHTGGNYEILQNQRGIIIDNEHQKTSGRRRSQLIVLDKLHYIKPELASALNERGLIDYIRAAGAAPSQSLREAAPEAQLSGHQDIGVVSGLAIKDLRVMTLDDKNTSFRAMTKLQREKVVKKETFIPRPSMRAYQAAGATPAIAAFVDKIWRQLPSKPESLMIHEIENYGKLMTGFSKVFEVAEKSLTNLAVTASEMDMDPIYAAIMQERNITELTQNEKDSVKDLVLFTQFTTGWLDAVEEHAYPAWVAVAKDNNDRGQRNWAEKQRLAENRRSTWAVRKTYDRASDSLQYDGYGPLAGLAFRQEAAEIGIDNFNDLMAQSVMKLFLEGTRYKIGSRVIALPTVEWTDLITERSGQSKSADKKGALVNNHKRVGEDYLKGRDVDGEDFIRTFGFSGVEYGNWVSQAERQEHLNLAYVSMLDMAKVLKIPPMALSLGGQLGLCFGSRGRGGKNAPLAHFEPSNMAINLTRMRGDGSLAHEYFHAIANFYGRLDTNRPLSDFSSRLGEPMKGRQWQPVPFDEAGAANPRIDPELQRAFYDLMVAIIRSPSDDAQANDITKFTELSPMLRFANLEDAERIAKGRDAYWGQAAELYARAMEHVVARKLSSTGEQNDYLVAARKTGEMEPAAEGVGNFFPTQVEYEKILPFADAWFDSLKTKMQAVNHPFLGAIEMPVLYSRNRVAMPLTPNELVPFVQHEFNRMFGKQQPKVAFVNGLDAAGSYHPAMNLVLLAASGADQGVVYHEGWHVARHTMLDQSQSDLVDRVFSDPAVAQWVTQQMEANGYSPEAISEAWSKPQELQAYAFELWATDRIDFSELETIYGEVKSGVEHAVALTRLLDVQQVSQLYESLRDGELARARNQAQQQVEQAVAPAEPVAARASFGMSL